MYLFVLTGYSAQAFELCCEWSSCAQEQHEKASPMQKAPADTHDCQCLCHQTPADPANKPLRVVGASVVSVESLPPGNQYPPDSLPIGIEYPPQLG